MRFIRFYLLNDVKRIEMKGIVDGNFVNRIHGSIFQGYSVANESYALEDIVYLPPVIPNALICCGSTGFPGYAKSVSSIGGNGSIVKYTQGLKVMPRIALISEPRSSNKILGACMMLDFVTALPADLYSSSDNYTLCGPSIWSNGWQSNNYSLYINSDYYNLEITADFENTVEGIRKLISLRPGDIVALPLSEKYFEVNSASEITLENTGLEKLKARLV